jgi:hypothetical protein
MEDDVRFYRRRVVEERRAAQRAITEAGRQRHEQLAFSFETRLRQLMAAE